MTDPIREAADCQSCVDLRQQLTDAHAEVAARDRTIAAMAAKAMSLVPGCKDVDDAWSKLERNT
jgi:hypothetical protein